MDLGICVHRDRVIRDYLIGRVWDENPEFRLLRALVLEGQPLLADVPYVFDYEWEVESGHSNLGRGDLVLTNGAGTFAVVEVKFIDDREGSTARTKRTKSRSKVQSQARQYARALAESLGGHAVVRAYAYTNEGGLVPVSFG